MNLLKATNIVEDMRKWRRESRASDCMPYSEVELEKALDMLVDNARDWWEEYGTGEAPPHLCCECCPCACGEEKETEGLCAEPASNLCEGGKRL